MPSSYPFCCCCMSNNLDITCLMSVGTKTLLFFSRYAGAVFADACLKGLNGVPDVVECSFVQSTIVPDLPFFASKVITLDFWGS